MHIRRSDDFNWFTDFYWFLLLHSLIFFEVINVWVKFHSYMNQFDMVLMSKEEPLSIFLFFSLFGTVLWFNSNSSVSGCFYFSFTLDYLSVFLSVSVNMFVLFSNSLFILLYFFLFAKKHCYKSDHFVYCCIILRFGRFMVLE